MNASVIIEIAIKNLQKITRTFNNSLDHVFFHLFNENANQSLKFAAVLVSEAFPGTRSSKDVLNRTIKICKDKFLFIGIAQVPC